LGVFLEEEEPCFQNFKAFSALLENQYDELVKCLRSKNGEEYVSKDFEI
jgi:hypothetical protein